MSQFNEWFDICGFENHYKINKSGNILSLKSNKILKAFDSSGYEKIILCKSGKKHRLFIHRLLALTYT